jgi:hypothetical protein
VRIVGALLGVALVLLVLADCFESILQPRRVTRRYRYARLFYVTTWAFWRAVARRMAPGKRQAAFLSAYGPLSLLGIFATWFLGLIVGFALLNWSLGLSIHAPEGRPTFGTYLYLSGTTFFTLGYGDVTPATPLGRCLAVGESGLGFGFLAAVLSYLPALFQAYSRREVSISTLDARAGSPPSAGQLLLRLARANNMSAAEPFLAEWERWAAELLEGQLSFPVLSYYRSQHDNESWLAALTVILDACALFMTYVSGQNTYQAQVTFAIARHAAVDLALALRTPAAAADRPGEDRLPAEQLRRLREALRDAGVEVRDDAAVAEAALRELRGMYEPFVAALAERLVLSLPPVMPMDETPDNWQRSAWMRPAPGIGKLPAATGIEDHFA